MASSLNVGHWIGLVVGAVILLLVVGALFVPFTAALASYAANDTSGFGAIVQSVAPILLGAGVLTAFVAAFLGAVHYKK